MLHRRALGLALPLAGLVSAAAMTGSASAATTQSFNCRASVVRVTALSSLSVEPFVANPSGSVCATDSANVLSGQVVNLSALGLALGGNLQVGPAEATTTSTVSNTDLGANASVTVSGLSIPVPLLSGTGGISIAGPITTSAGYSCVEGQPQASSSSNLSAISIGGTTHTFASGSSQTFQLLNGLGGALGTVSVDSNTLTGTTDTEDLLNINIAGLAQIVVGESVATTPAAGACDSLPVPNPDPQPDPSGGPVTTTTHRGSTTTTTTTTTNNSSTAHSTDVTLQELEKEVSGGRIVTLTYARRHFRSACLKGRGSHWVVVGNKRNNRIRVRKYQVRILGLGGNDKITVKGGNNTCVDGGAGKDTITNLGSNAVRVYGGGGNDRIRLGKGAAFVSAGSGRNVVIAKGANVKVKAGKGKTIAYLLRANAAYAKHHGVRVVHMLRG